MSRLGLVVLAVLVFVWPHAAWAQVTPAGVVTTLQGTVTATRATSPQPQPLKFRDTVYVNDRIVTGEQSVARLLLGGVAVVTVRERSSLTITEVPGRATLNLESGKLGLAVAKERMRSGESIDIRTPNAVAGIRGTVVVAEYTQASAQAPGGMATGGLTRFFALSGTFQAIFGTQSFVVGPGQFVSGNLAGGNLGTITPAILSAALAGLQTRLAPVKSGSDGAKDQALGTTAATFGGELALIEGRGGEDVDTLLRNARLDLPPNVDSSSRTLPGGETQVGASSPGATTGSAGSPPPVVGGPPPVGSPVPDFGQRNRAFDNCDDCSSKVNFGFAFPFRGQHFASGELSSNGFIMLGGANGASSFVPTVGDFLSLPARIAAAWTDHDLRIGNGLRVNTSIPGIAAFTYDSVGEFNQVPRHNTFQIQLLSSGQIVFVYQNLTIGTHNTLVGVTPGNGAIDPGPSTFTPGGSFSTGSADTVYQIFGPGTFNLSGHSLVFTPNASGGWDVSDPDVPGGPGFVLPLVGGPLFDLKGTPLTSSRPLYALGSGLHDSLFEPVMYALASPLTLPAGLMSLEGASLDAGSTRPLVWLDASPVTVAASVARLTNSDVTTAGSFLRVENGSEIVQGGSAEALLLVQGGSLRVGSDGASGNVLEALGRRAFALADPDPDPVTGAATGLVLGTDRPLQPAPGVPVVQADAGAVVEVRGSVYKADAALLEATAPLLLAARNSSVTTGSHAVDLVRSKVAIPSDAVAMLQVDRSTLNVLSGYLVNASGSRLALAGDLLRVSNGGLVNVFNGALLNLTGGSVVSIDGALVRFTGTPGSVLNVTNTLAPTTFVSGVPIYVAPGATANLSLGAGALAGLNIGTIRINNTALPAGAGPGSVSGSLVAVQGTGGTLKVKGN